MKIILSEKANKTDIISISSLIRAYSSNGEVDGFVLEQGDKTEIILYAYNGGIVNITDNETYIIDDGDYDMVLEGFDDNEGIYATPISTEVIAKKIKTEKTMEVRKNV